MSAEVALAAEAGLLFEGVFGAGADITIYARSEESQLVSRYDAVQAEVEEGSKKQPVTPRGARFIYTPVGGPT